MNNAIVRRRQRQKTTRQKTWSLWGLSGCSNWSSNRHQIMPPPIMTKKAQWQQSIARVRRRQDTELEDEKKDRKGRRSRHQSRTPSISPSRSPPIHRSRSRTRRSISSKPDKRDINPTSCPHCKEYGGYGLSHAAPKNMPRDKCNYNKK